MIALSTYGEISDIFLTVSLIILLIFYEFGSDKIKKQFLPFVVVMLLIFATIAFLNVYSQLK